MPGDDGIWLLDQVNQQSRRIPVIVMSGYDESQEPRLATAPFARKLLKPLDFDRVCAEVAAALDGSAGRMPPGPSVDLDARGRRLRATSPRRVLRLLADLGVLR
jgi:DNA-binding NtrC family response regulator